MSSPLARKLDHSYETKRPDHRSEFALGGPYVSNKSRNFPIHLIESQDYGNVNRTVDDLSSKEIKDVKNDITLVGEYK